MLRKCLSEDTMLPPARHNFFLLQIQIIFRFSKWASVQIAVCSDYGEDIDYASLVCLHEDLLKLSTLIPALFQIEDAANESESIFSAAHEEIRKRISESVTLIRKYVQDHIIGIVT